MHRVVEVFPSSVTLLLQAGLDGKEWRTLRRNIIQWPNSFRLGSNAGLDVEARGGGVHQCNMSVFQTTNV